MMWLTLAKWKLLPLVVVMLYTFDPPEPELNSPGWWQIDPNSFIVATDIYGAHSAPNALAMNFNSNPPSIGACMIYKELTDITPGDQLNLSLYINDAGANSTTLSVFVYDRDPDAWYGNLLGQFSVTAAQVGAGWQPWNLGSVLPSTPHVIVELWVNGAFKTTGRWLVDDFVYTQQPGVNIMAVLLAELPLRSMLALMQNNLGAEITAINNERQDSVTIANPSSYRCWKATDPDPDVAECEIYVEDSGSGFPSFKQEAQKWYTGTRTNMRSTARITCAINFANRTSRKVSEMHVMALRYGAAMARVIRNNPDLGVTGKSTMTTPETIRYSVRRTAGENPRLYQRVEMTTTVDISEDASGETTNGGGIPPSCTLET